MSIDAQRRKERVALLSVVSNTTLVVLKLAVGLLIGSVSVISEAIHSGVDLTAAVIAFFSVKTSSLPADGKHPFGHGKIENISGTVEALLIFIAAGWIIWEAVGKLLRPQAVETVGWGIGVMLLSAATNAGVARMLFKVGKETDSVALMADGWHLRTDVYTSAGVMAGLAVMWGGESLFPGKHFHWLDPLAAIGVALLIIKAAWELTRQSAGGLMDETLPPEEETEIRRLIAAHFPVIHGYHQLRTRKAGPFRFVEVHIQVDGQMSVETAHRLNQELVREIRERFPHVTVTVHTEPYSGLCGAKCLSGCLLPEEERNRLQRNPRK
ncbi:MAG: cation diffusion facilitator family transporter [Deltaproteobacteria bacterium]|nr:cation diffusion facilitator family transporter [Deltaproteobacteria bacterium]